MIVKLCKDKITGEFASPGGNSEIWGDKHYNDLLKGYVDNEYFTMNFYDENINSDIETQYTFSKDSKTIIYK